METLTANLAGKPRHEDWNGRQYLVVPLTMLVPGVLQGSKGPLLYPPEEVRKSPDDWNHIPIVIYHPMKDGKPVSARSPSILSKYGVGFVFHSRTDSKGVLKGEGWLDVEATRRVDKSVLDSVQLGRPIELSTGLFVDNDPAPDGAIFNDHRGTRKYVGVARNYKPDHLAILPSGKGACSLADGCGVLINEAAMEAYQVIINELETEAVSLYFPDLELDLLTANKFNPNQPRDKSGRFATVAAATKKVEKAQGRVSKAQAALDKAKATLKVEKSGLLVAKKGLSEAKAREKAKSPAASNAIEKAKASTETTVKAKTTRTSPAESKKAGTEGLRLAEQFSTDLKAVSDSNGHHRDRELAKGTADELNKTATRMGKPELLDVLDTFTQGISRKVYEKRSAPALRSELGRILSSVYGATLRSTAASESGIASKPSNPRAHGMGKATGGSRSTTGTPTNPKPAASTAAKAGSTPDFHTLAHSTHEANKRLTDVRSGLTPVIPRLHEEVAKAHPGLTEKAFHEHLKELAKKDIATLQVWETSVPISTSGYPRSRFPSGGSHDAQPIGWVQFHRDATSRINAEPGRVKSGSGTTTPAAPKPAASPKAGKSGKSVDEHHAETEALIRSPMSHQDASKAVDSHITNLNKSLNKAQTHELGQKLGLTHPKSATKKSVLDRIKTHIHARRGAHH